MRNSLERIQIVGLHGTKTIDIKIDDNTLVLIGENGSGKTTILRMIFYFLSGRWISLIPIRFDSIVATINGNEHRITRKELVSNFKITDRSLRDLPSPIRERLIEIMRTGQFDQVPVEVKKFSERYGYPLDLIMRRIEMPDEMHEVLNKKIRQDIDIVRNAISAQILYLPTYRRIERELSSIFEGMDMDDVRRRKIRFPQHESDEGFIELVEFGMRDVQNAVDRELSSLKEFARENLNSLTLGYLGDVVNQEYQNVDLNEIADISEASIHSVLDRIDESILTKSHKDHIFRVISSASSSDSQIEYSKIIFHYFRKLLKFQKLLQEKEKPISAFCALCSEYAVDKRFVYNSADFSFSIVPKYDNKTSETIKLSDLSSGEKQIVSLFSHLYLSRQKSFFVLIDEPELSLSVPWQRRFLADIHKGEFCAGLIAATHSPFIYNNELHQYAHSLGEFIKSY
jgi:predicted ATPase